MPTPNSNRDTQFEGSARARVVALISRLKEKLAGPFGKSMEAEAVFMVLAIPRSGFDPDEHERAALTLCQEYLSGCFKDAIENVDGTRLRLIANALDEARRQLEAGIFGSSDNRSLQLSVLFVGEQHRAKKAVTRSGLLAYLKANGLRITERQATNILKDLGLKDKRGRRVGSKNKIKGEAKS